ncbi:hypothetical protein HY251_07095 [bacterium]|nr:hypothetical protein [bacterium]
MALACALGQLALAGDEPEAVRKVREQLPELRKKLERARGAKLEGEIKVAHLTDEELRARLEKEVERDYPDARAIDRTLARLGLFSESYDLKRDIVETEAVQALAFYDPEKKTFFIAKPDLPEADLRAAVIHELDHALQDSRFDLMKLRRGALGDEDRENALTFLIEGEASYVMALSIARDGGVPVALADMAVESEASLSREQVLEKLERSAEKAGERGKAKRASYRCSKEMPLYVYRTLVEPYVRGSAYVARIRRRGGWEAVDALFRDPPRSTSECLHPERPRAKPVSLSLPDLGPLLGEDWKPIHADTLGELGLDCFLKERLGPGHEDVAPGWRGDRLGAFARGERTAVLWLTSWESERAALAFLAAATEIAKGDASRLREGEASRASRSGKKVAVALGLPAASCDEALEMTLRR